MVLPRRGSGNWPANFRCLSGAKRRNGFVAYQVPVGAPSSAKCGIEFSGLAFTYRVVGNAVIPSRTRYQIARSDFEKAYELVPLGGPGEINRLVRGPAYVWGILHDTRVQARRGMNWQQFQELARQRMSEELGARLSEGTVPGIPKRFDMISPDGRTVGDAKYLTLVQRPRVPPAKFMEIAGQVWLLEKTRAARMLLVFGNQQARSAGVLRSRRSQLLGGA